MPREGRRWEEAADGADPPVEPSDAFGGREQVLAWAQEHAVPVQDVRDAFVLPGFVDAHMHFLSVGLKRSRPHLEAARTLEDALALVEAWLREHPGPDPVVAEGWDESEWPGRARPTRRLLDTIAARLGQPDRPVVLRRVCGHIAVANSAALGPIVSRWPDPSRTDRDSGLLREEPSLYLNEAFPASDAQLDAALQYATREAHRLGVTTVGDYSQAPYRAAILRAAASGTLGVRIASSFYVQQLAQELEAGFRTGRRRGPWLRDAGMKVFLDGSLGGRTAALREPYLDAPPGTPSDCPERRSRHGCVGHPHVRGTLNWGDEDVRRLFLQAHVAGVQLHAHAIGDAAIDQGLEAFRALEQAAPGPGADALMAAERQTEAGAGGVARLRHRFEHFEVAHEDQVRETARLGVVASCQPNFVGVWSSKGGMYEERMGTRYAVNNRFQTFRRLGVRVAFGSDGMPFGPVEGIRAAMHHPIEEERMGFLQAVWHYTAMAAWSLHWEDDVGTLAVGHAADLVVVSPRLEVLQTVQDGVTVHRLQD